MSRRQFVGTAAAGAAALGAVAGAAKLIPHVAGAPATAGVKAREEARTINRSGPAPIPSSWDYTTDVVVVGYGGAGAAAAITAHDNGASVIVLEKAPTADGGNTGVCGGQVFSPVLAANGGSVQDFITYHKMIHYGTVDDDELIAALCQGIANLPAWFQSLGRGGVYSAFVSSVPRSLVTGFVSPSFQSQANWTNYWYAKTATGGQGGGVDAMVFLEGCVSSRGIPVLLSTPAEKVIQDPNTKEVVGVQAVDWKGAVLNIKANKGVILACGGFENNNEMRNQFEPWAHANAPFLSFYGTPYNTGDGITMAQSVGAKLWHMNNKEWTGDGFGIKPACQEVGMGIAPAGVGILSGTNSPAIVVNRYGRRFMNEDIYTIHSAQLLPMDQLVELNGLAPGVGVYDPEYSYLPPGSLPPAAAAQSVTTDYVDYPNTPFYVVFDSTLFKSGPVGDGLYAGAVSALHPTPHYAWSSDNSVELAKGWILTGATPTALGSNIVCYDYFGRVVGMNAANLATTITNYNSYAASGKDLDWGRPASSMVALNNPPYYAMELCICSLNTNGGPVHDQYGRTIDVYNNPIPRLYSVGENGSIFGYLYHSGGNYPEALVMGQYAGKHAASLPPYTQPPA